MQEAGAGYREAIPMGKIVWAWSRPCELDSPIALPLSIPDTAAARVAGVASGCQPSTHSRTKKPIG